MVKTQKQYHDLLRLYLKHSQWTISFMHKVAVKLELTPSQVYKWCWDRNDQERRQMIMLRESEVLPDRIWYVTKVRKSSRISKKRRALM